MPPKKQKYATYTERLEEIGIAMSDMQEVEGTKYPIATLTCSEGHVTTGISLKTISNRLSEAYVCYECKPKKSVTKDNTIDACKKLGFKLLEFDEKTYIAKYECCCGSIHETAYTNITSSTRGPNCNDCKNKNCYEDVKKFFKDAGCKLLSTDYKNNQQILEYRCQCKNISKITFCNFQQGERCMKCRSKRTLDNDSEDIESYNDLTCSKLIEKLNKIGIKKGLSRLKKQELIDKLMEEESK